MPDSPATSRERWVESRARDLLGAEVRLARRIITTRSARGGRSRMIVGYQLCRRIPDGEIVIGMSPPEGAPLDLAALGAPEAALRDAVERNNAGCGAYADAEPGCPPLVLPARRRGSRPDRPPRPTSEFTTSTISLPSP